MTEHFSLDAPPTDDDTAEWSDVSRALVLAGFTDADVERIRNALEDCGFAVVNKVTTVTPPTE